MISDTAGIIIGVAVGLTVVAAYIIVKAVKAYGEGWPDA